MKTYVLFQQYIWLVNTIHKYRRLTFEEINEYWVNTEMSEGLPIPRTTFNRHRDAILDMFGVIIECDKKDGFKYYIENSEVLEVNTIQNWMLSTLSVNNMLSESKSVHDRILLEQIPSDGENLHHFINAMKLGHRVNVCYCRYGVRNKGTMMTLDPYFVKLFNKRWYALVKYPEENAHLFTLAFDRMLSVDISEEKYEYDNEFKPIEWFNYCYGIVRDDDVPIEKVVIRAFGKEANYMRDLPLHHSQQEVLTHTDYSDFEMTLRPSSDFFTPLLSRGAAIKVMSPQWLVEEIKEQHRAALERYSNQMK